MSVHNSSIDPELLQGKVEAVAKVASNLHLTLVTEKKSPQEFLFKYKELVPLISSFNAMNSAILNSNALIIADIIADRGLELAKVIDAYQLNHDHKLETSKLLLEASQDLKKYCKKGRDWVANFTFTEGGIKNEFDEGGNSERNRSKFEDVENSFLELNAKLKKLQETVDVALLRAEVVTGQQADSIRETLTREVSSITDEFGSTNEALKARLIEFDAYREQATKLLSAMAAEALAGGHIESAKQEEKIANDFRERALTAMKWGGGAIGIILLIALFQNFSWIGIANRAMLVLLIVAPTAYLARESAKHRAQAVELRRASLDFAAIEPFLKGIQGEEGLRVRADLARKAFFSGNPVDATSSYGLDPQALLTKLMDTLSDVSKTKT